jgi:GT2 family glycosyltransferase
VETPLVVVVVLNRNGFSDTDACLRSLAELDYARRETVLVDNGSTDDSVELLRRDHPSLTVLRTDVNRGFGGGANVGIRHALGHGADLVWLVNNDAVVEPGALSALVETAAADPRIGIVGSAVYRFDERSRLESWGGSTYNAILGFPTPATEPVPARELAFITGASMLLRRELVEDVGVFDERFFIYMEDADLCRRARRRGWRLEVAGGSVVFHKGGRTVNNGSPDRSLPGDRFQAHGSGVFLGKHAGPAIVVAAPLRLVGIVARRVARRQLRSIPPVVGGFLSGLGTGLRRGAEPSQHNP